MRDDDSCQANPAQETRILSGTRATAELTDRNTARFAASSSTVSHRADLTRMLRKSLMVFLSPAAADATLPLTLVPQFSEMSVIQVGAC